MAKLPDDFVKPPSTSRLTTSKPAAGKLGRRTRKSTDAAEVERELTASADGHVHAVLVQLSDEEHGALTAACQALAVVGHTVSLEDMIKQVIARWIAATRAMQAVAPSPMAPSVPAIASIRGQLRKLASEPVRRWHELGQTVRRWSQRLALRR